MTTKTQNDGRLASSDDAEQDQDKRPYAEQIVEELLRMGIDSDDDIARAIRALGPLWDWLAEEGENCYELEEASGKKDEHSREEDGIMLRFMCCDNDGYSVAITPGKEGRVEIQERRESGHKLNFRSAEAGTGAHGQLDEGFYPMTTTARQLANDANPRL